MQKHNLLKIDEVVIESLSRINYYVQTYCKSQTLTQSANLLSRRKKVLLPNSVSMLFWSATPSFFLRRCFLTITTD